MAPLTPTYRTSAFALPLARLGGPRRPRLPRFERPQHQTPLGGGSHAPLDIHPHWDWRNPLNIIPAAVLGTFVLGVVAMLV